MADRRHISSYVVPHRWSIVMAGVVIAITVAVNLMLPVIIRIAIDEITSGEIESSRLLHYVGWYSLGVGISVLFAFWTRWLPMRISHKIEYSIRRDMFKHLTEMDQNFFRTERTGDLMTRMTSDITILRNAVGQGILQGLRSSLVFIGAFSVMFLSSWRLALLMAALFPMLTLLFYVLIKRVRRAHEQVQEQYAEVSNFSQESFAGIRSIKGFALEQRWREHFSELNTGMLKRFMKLSFSEEPLWPLAAFWFSLGMISILIVGGRQVVKGELTLGTLVQFIQYLLYMQWPMLALSWTASLMQRAAASWERINLIFMQSPGIADDESTNSELKVLSGDICFKNVSLEVDGVRLLNEINLRIPSGVTIGITGPTGSGKTLLVSLLARLMDVSGGELCIGTHNIREYPLKVLRSQIGFAAQEPVLFSRPLGENIAFGIETQSADVVGWAAKVANLDVDVEGFPDHYDTILGERGVTLSGGQRQRASLSRAIAREPAILILDDVLAAVDTQTEAGIMNRLLPVMRGRTSIMVSHRISTLSYADFMIVVEDGRITQRGTHAELLAEKGYYAELNELQKIEQELDIDNE